MKRVLIITYYWPPSGGSGVQRWLKMSKYLPENGWQPVIYTAKDAEYPVEDLSLEKDVCPEAEVIRRPIVEPYAFYKKFLGKKKDERVKAGLINESGSKSGWKERLSVWIRGNFFIPDARCWWIRPSVRYLKKYLKEHPVDAIISTGPPHSMHLIAKKLHERLDTPWVADFRDPWTDIYYADSLHLGKRANRKHQQLEESVLNTANQVVIVSQSCANALIEKGVSTFDIIPNGFDCEINTRTKEKTDKFVISHIGIIPPKSSSLIWESLSELVSEDSSFAAALEIRLVGHIDQSVLKTLQELRLDPFTKVLPYLPHNQAIEEQRNSDMLLLLIPDAPSAKGILTGKLFEYMTSDRPILCIGPEDGDAAAIIAETQTGMTIDFKDKEKMKAAIAEVYRKYQNDESATWGNQLVERYSRKALTKQYSQLLNTLSNGKRVSR